MRLALGTGPGAPKLSLRADFGLKSMKLRVYREKLMLVHHLRTLDSEALASEMYSEQVKNNWPGLAREAEEICEHLGIQSVNKTLLNKKQFSQLIDTVLVQKENQILQEDSVNMEKMKIIRSEKWGLKDYVVAGNLYSVRSTWEVRAYMLRVAGNYSHHSRYLATGWLCQACRLQVREDQDHLGSCEGYEDLREGKNLDDDKELVEFIQQVMRRRERQGWE